MQARSLNGTTGESFTVFRMNKRVLLLACVLLLFAMQLGFANTTARVEGCEIIITLNLAFAGPGANQTYLNHVNQSIAKYWNTGMTFGECKCKVKVETNMILVQNCTPPTSGRHCVNVKKTSGFHRSTVTAGTWKSPSVPSGTGEWGSGDSEAVTAHEVGHLLGLPDEYEDCYNYYYAYANGTNATPPAEIGAGEYTVPKATELAGKAPPGTTIKFVHNPATCNATFSRVMPGKDPNSLMAGIGANAKVTQGLIDDLCGRTGVKCPDHCCCGNGKKDSMEQCDPKATPDGCPVGQKCNLNCTCQQTTPRCGDGWIYRPPNYGQPGAGGEECDWNATPTGCDDDEICLLDCTCLNVSIRIIEPEPYARLTVPTQVKASAQIDGTVVSRMGFYLNGVLRHTDYEAPFLWTLNPNDYEPGEYGLSVVADGPEGIQAEASQVVYIAHDEPAPTPTPEPTPVEKCGNGGCEPEFGENCETCLLDCACGPGMECLPLSPAADPLGCVAGGSCGDGMCMPGEFCYTCPMDCMCPDGSVCVPDYPDFFGCAP